MTTRSACFFIIFEVEQFISYMWFSKRYNKKRSDMLVFSCYILSWFLQFGVYIIKMPELNLITFFIFNIAISLFCFDIKPLSSVLNTLLLEGIMFTSEVAVLFVVSRLKDIPFKIPPLASQDMAIDYFAAKALYFTVVFGLLILTNKKQSGTAAKTAESLIMLPAISVFIIIGFRYLIIHGNPDRKALEAFAILSGALLFADVIIFGIWEYALKILEKNKELTLIELKAENDREYYSELERKLDAEKMLFHDINGHLSAIKNLSDENKVREYVDSILENKEFFPMRTFSDNKLVNVIASRYAHIANDKDIAFEVDIRSEPYETIDPSSLTSILDNLLRNAVEAAEKADYKFIAFYMRSVNDCVLLINVRNTCKQNPFINNKYLHSTKENPEKHGLGLKSVERIVKNSAGRLKTEYIEETKLFDVRVFLPIDKNP